MTEPPERGRGRDPAGPDGDDGTRNIRLPPVPGRAAPVPPPEPAGPPQQSAGSLADQPTDRLEPPEGTPRQQTLAFTPPLAPGGEPDAPGTGTGAADADVARPRRWPWVLVGLLPVLVIAVTGIWLFLLLRAG